MGVGGFGRRCCITWKGARGGGQGSMLTVGCGFAVALVGLGAD